jgi:predicted enzyme related to lactoylglutathione lyase
MNTPENQHRLDYVEFATRDVSAAKKFYSAVFGWKFTDYGPEYTSFSDGRLSGGFRGDAKARASTNPLIVLYSLDLERTQSAVLNASGIVVLPTHEFPGGRRFHFSDPNGLELAVWSDRRLDGTKIE